MINNNQINKQPNKNRNLFLISCLGLAIMSFVAVKYFFAEQNFSADKKDESNKATTKIYKKSDQQDLGNISDNNLYQASTTEDKASKELYASLMKQELQIESLQEKYNFIKSELEKNKNQDKLSKIIISFSEVKDCISSRQNCESKLQKFELLAKYDSNLSGKIAALRAILQNNPKSSQQLKSQFNTLIPNIMVAESLIKSQNYFDKIKYNLAKLIVIRRIDGNVGDKNIDSVILEIQKLLDENKYAEALNILSAQNEIYKPVLSDFVADLQNVNQLNKITSEIFSYLKEI